MLFGRNVQPKPCYYGGTLSFVHSRHHRRLRAIAAIFPSGLNPNRGALLRMASAM
jgi:hypothetical protein